MSENRPLPPPITAAQFEGPAFAAYYYSRSIHERCERPINTNFAVVDVVPIHPSERLLWPELSDEIVAIAVEEHYQDALSGYRVVVYGLTERSLAFLRG